MRIHILGICGTFMAGLAVLARELGVEVTGSDAHVYPPMSDMLGAAGIAVREGYEPGHLSPAPDLVVIGNALTRGNPAVEHVLAEGLRFTSGPAWLADHVLAGRWVLAVAGTHGKTTTSSMLAWILEHAGRAPGFLIGGVPRNFGISARGGGAPLFVVEADEYDSAFFDKRSKFVHYLPRTLVINNIEYDHADIFPDLGAILTQFHHLIRIVPANGLIVCPDGDETVAAALERGVWTPVLRVGAPAGALRARPGEGSSFAVVGAGGERLGEVRWRLAGRHNVANALAAIAAARHAGVEVAAACEALGSFAGVARRLEPLGAPRGVEVYDDFAHHPTAVAATLEALQRPGREGRLLTLLEPRSNTMRMGVHRTALAPALGAADAVWALRPRDLDWSLEEALAPLGARAHVCDSVETIVCEVAAQARAGDRIVIMSNGAFDGIQDRLLGALRRRQEPAA